MKFWRTAAAAFVLSLGATQLSAQVMTVTTQLPERDPLSQNWLEFGNLINERSGGALGIQLFHSGQLFADNQVPEAVGTGAVHAGTASLVRYAGAVPAVNAISVPFMLETEEQLRAATAPESPVRELLDAAILAETNNRVLWWQGFGRNIYLSKGRALRSPADFEGQSVRSYGAVQSWTVEALGGAPTIVSGGEQFLAYQQGTVDVGMTGASSVAHRRLYEVMDHMTLSYDSAIEFLAVINNDFFESLSPEHQEIILEAAVEVEQQLRDFMIEDEDSLVDEVRPHMTVIELTEEEVAAFREATAPVRERFLEASGDLGRQVLEAIDGL
jgi:C4-dicarboxylate-binding protein DctP